MVTVTLKPCDLRWMNEKSSSEL